MNIPISVENPLWDSDLEIAARFCLAMAATTDRDQAPFGVGGTICRTFHDRRKRFQEAWEKRMKGVSSLLELGLSAEDCAWAATQAHRTRKPLDWELRFKTAENRLRVAGSE